MNPTQKKLSRNRGAPKGKFLLEISISLALYAQSALAQTSGSLNVSTHVTSTIGTQVNRQTPQSATSGPLSLTDSIVASVPHAPANYSYAQALAFADWAPGAVKAEATARIDGLCIPNGGGGCEGPGTTWAGATASASTLTVSDPGVQSPTSVQNNLLLSGTMLRKATFISPDTETAFTNGTVPDATASFSFSIRQLQFNPDAGHDVYVVRAQGGVSVVSHYDGTVALTTSGFLQHPTWTGAPLALTTPTYTLQPGKDIEVQFSATVNSSFLYSLRAADVLLSSLGFGNTFKFSTDPNMPAFTSADVNIPALSIQGGVYTEPIPQPPQMTIVPSGGAILLTWPTNAAGFVFVLQSTTNLAPPAVWTTNSPGPDVVNGLNTVTNPISGPQQFYRLFR